MSKALRYIAGAVLIVVGAFTTAYGGSSLIVAGISMIVGAALEKTPRKLRRLQEQTVMVRSAVAPQEIVYGRTRKSGVVVWYDANGPKNKYLWFVIAVCEHEIDGYEQLWIDNEPVDIATEIDVDGFVTNPTFVDSDGNKLVKTGFYTGTATQTADADLVASTVYWTSDHAGKGVAYFWVRLEIDSSKGGTDPENPGTNVWAKGYPRDLSVVLRGAKIYDPRLDSTMVIDSTTSPVTYGSGSHRVDTPSTWEWSNNSVLVRADYIRHDRFGPGYTSSDIDWETVAAQADIADLDVTVPDGAGGTTTQKNHTIDGIVSTDDQPKQIIESLQSADHGTTLFNPGDIQIFTGAWKTPTHTIDSDWLAGTYSATSSVPADNAYNAVRGQYLSADENYTLIGFQPVTSSAYETEDGIGRQWSDVALSYTTDEYRAQRLAIIELKKSRLQTSMTIECGPIAEQVDVYDTVTVDLPGYSSESSPSGVKTFRVTSKSSTTDGITSLTLKEEQESDWTYDVADLATPPVVPSVSRGEGVLDTPTSLTATTAVNGIILDWAEPADLANVDYYDVWASATNDRAAATLLARTTQPTYMQRLDEGVERYYWVRSMSSYGYTSAFEPASATGGVYGIAGETGADAILYYIKPTAGTAIQNSTGELTVEAHLVTGGVDIHLNSGDIKLYVSDGASPEVFTEVTELNGYGVGSDGYTGVFDSGDINGSVTVQLRDSVTGVTKDTITLVDVADGGDAVYGYINAINTRAWVRESDQTTFDPTDTFTDVDITFVQGGADAARGRVRVSRDSGGLLTASALGVYTHASGNLNASRISRTIIGSGTKTLTLVFDYSFGGDTSKASETFVVTLSGEDGISAALTNSNPVISADIEGFNYSLSGASSNQVDGSFGTFEVFQGSTDLTGLVDNMYRQDNTDGWDTSGTINTYTSGGLIFYINEDTGAYGCRVDSGATAYRNWTGDSLTKSVRVLIDGAYHTRQFTITKTKGNSSQSVYTKIKPAVSTQTVGTGTAYAGFKYDADGNIYVRNGEFWSLTTWDWLYAGANSEYEIRATLVSGDNPTTGTMDTWQALSTDRSWTWSTTGAATEGRIEVSIRRASTSLELSDIELYGYAWVNPE